MKIKQGATRKVFVFKKVVVKIPTIIEYRLFLNGILANLQEKSFSGIHSDLAKVKFCDKLGLILIMEKVDVLSNDINWLDFNNSLKEKYKNDKLKDFLLSDCKPSNWGYINNHLVKVDYGD